MTRRGINEGCRPPYGKLGPAPLDGSWPREPVFGPLRPCLVDLAAGARLYTLDALCPPCLFEVMAVLDLTSGAELPWHPVLRQIVDQRVCLVCGWATSSPGDRENNYCGRCDDTTPGWTRDNP